jgi:4-diphosphocytidyl-2C-methyl-D-erythritol kinase
VVVPFDFGVRTSDAYRWWDEDGGPHAPEGPHPNDLEEPVVKRHPRIGEAKRLLLDAGSSSVIMSGSGPTLFGILPSPHASEDRAMEGALTNLTGRSVLRAHSANPGHRAELR